MGYIKTGQSEGATLLTGGDKAADLGYYIQPTVFGDVSDDMTICREEIFGPVQAIQRFKVQCSFSRYLRKQAKNADFFLKSCHVFVYFVI